MRDRPSRSEPARAGGCCVEHDARLRGFSGCRRPAGAYAGARDLRGRDAMRQAVLRPRFLVVGRAARALRLSRAPGSVSRSHVRGDLRLCRRGGPDLCCRRRAWQAASLSAALGLARSDESSNGRWNFSFAATACPRRIAQRNSVASNWGVNHPPESGRSSQTKETPRLCRGGSSSLTFKGVHQ